MKPAMRWALSIMLLSAGATACGQTPAASLSTVTGVPLCEPAAENKVKGFKLSGIFLGSTKRHCWVWDDVEPGFIIWSSKNTPDALSLPTVIATRKGTLPMPGGRIFLRVIGGPGGSIAPNIGYGLTLNLLRPGDLLITPAYQGTSHGTLYPAENFTAASSRIAAWLRELRGRNPDAEIVLIGESLGAAIALEATRQADFDRPDKIVLLSPLAFSPSDAERNFTALRGAEYRNDRKKSVFLLHPADAKASRWETVYSTDLFKTFFPAAQRAIALPARLESAKQVPVLIVYGSGDRVAGLTVIQGLSPRPGLTVIRIENMPHYVDRSFVDAVNSPVQHFLDQPR